MRKGLAEQNKSDRTQDEADVAAPEAVFGAVGASVTADVAVGIEIIKPMAPDFTDYSTDAGSNVKKSDLYRSEVIGGRRQELGDCGYEADGPHKEYHRGAGG